MADIDNKSSLRAALLGSIEDVVSELCEYEGYHTPENAAKDHRKRAAWNAGTLVEKCLKTGEHVRPEAIFLGSLSSFHLAVKDGDRLSVELEGGWVTKPEALEDAA